MRVEIVLFDGYDELDAIGPFEILSNLRVGRPETEVRMVTVEAAAQAVGSHGLRTEVDGELDEGADLILVPGGGWADGREDGVRGQIALGVLPDRLAAAHAGGATIAGVCSGVMILGAAGLLDGRPATTIDAALKDLSGFGARAFEERVVDDGDIVTCGGVTACLDLAFWLVERECGTSYARAIATGMEYERRGGVHLGSGATRAGHRRPPK
jgi:transcriptional regulator GlxA family with amidase domain